MSTFSPSAPSAAYSHMHMSQVELLLDHVNEKWAQMGVKKHKLTLNKNLSSFRVTEAWELRVTSRRTLLPTMEICAVRLLLVIDSL